MGNTTSSNQNTASNSATNANTNYGSNTNSNTAQNTANNSLTQTASGPSAAAQGFLNTINPTTTANNIQAFESPYTQQVLDAQVAVQNQQNSESQAQLLGNSVGAVNGNRLSQAQATLARQQKLADNSANANTLNQGYNTAANLATTQGQQALSAAGLAGTQSSSGTQQTGNTQGTTQSGTQGTTSTAQNTAQAGTGSGSSTTSPGLLSYAGLGAGLLAKDGGAISYADGGAPRPPKIPKSFPIASIGDFGELHFVPKKHPKKFGDGGTAGGDQADPYSMEGIQKAIKAMLDRSQGATGNKSAQGGQGGQNSFNLASDQFNSGAKIGQGLASAGQNAGAKLFGSSQDASSQGLLGSGGLNNTLSNVGSSIGDFAGFAKGGSTGQTTASAATPEQYYTPISLSSLQTQMPSVASPQASMPSVPGASVAQATVPTPHVAQASSGKHLGSGGTVRAYNAGGRARHREVSAAAPRRFASGGASEDEDTAALKADIYGLLSPERQEALTRSLSRPAISAPVTAAPPSPELAVSPPAGGLPALSSAPASAPQPVSSAETAPAVLWQRDGLPSLSGAPAATPQPASPSPSASSAPRPQTVVPDITSAHHFEGGLGSMASDTNGSTSYGRYGLNSQPGNSAWQFQRDYPNLGLTAQPGTQEFNAQWSKLAQERPEDLQAAETDWHNKNIGAKVLPSLQRAGVSEAIARDPRVQAYVADRMVQQGENSTVNHQGRFQQAEAASGGDPAKFLQALTQIDKAHVGGDFQSYLQEHPGNVKGLENRSDNRLTAALGGTPTAGTSQATGGREVQPSALGRIASMLGINAASAQGAGDKHLINGPIGEGARGLLGALGLNTSPEALGKVSRLLMAMGQGQGFQGGMGNEELMLKQQQAQREAQHLASQLGIEQGKLKLEQAKFAQPIKIGEFQDFSGTHAIYGAPVVDPQTGKISYTPVNASAANGRPAGMTPLSQIDPNLHGEELLKAANLSAPDAELIRSAARYDLPVSAMALIKKPEIAGLVAQYKPGWDEKQYANQQATMKSFGSGVDAKSNATLSQALQHAGVLDYKLKKLENPTSAPWLNSAVNAVRARNPFADPQSEDTYLAHRRSAHQALNAYTHEAAKVFKQVGVITDQELKQLNEALNIEDPYGAQRASYKTILELFAGRFESQADKYNRVMNPSGIPELNKTGFDFMSPKAKETYAKLMAGAEGAETGRPYQVSGRAELDDLIKKNLLHRGDQFLDEDGNPHTLK